MLAKADLLILLTSVDGLIHGSKTVPVVKDIEVRGSGMCAAR